MGIAIIPDEINKYIDMLEHHYNDLYILEKAFNEIEELYCKLDELNDTYNACIDRLEGNNYVEDTI
jgi:hypothetical protein